MHSHAYMRAVECACSQHFAYLRMSMCVKMVAYCHAVERSCNTFAHFASKPRSPIICQHTAIKYIFTHLRIYIYSRGACCLWLACASSKI